MGYTETLKIFQDEEIFWLLYQMFFSAKETQ